MPCDYTKYRSDWKEIRKRILEREGDCCKTCGVANGMVGYRDKDGKFYSSHFIEDCLENNGRDLFDDVLSNCFDKKGNPTKPIKIVLTVAHLNHDVMDNSDDNLAALCQYHHLRHDIDQHKANSRETNRKKKGLQNLF